MCLRTREMAQVHWARGVFSLEKLGKRGLKRLFDSVAERPIPGPSLCRHPRQHGYRFIDVVEDERIGLPVVPPVQPSNVLRERSLPGDRHREEQCVKSGIVESFAEIAASGEDQSLPASRLGKRGIGGGTLGFRHAAP